MKVISIFTSISGEVGHIPQGTIVQFVRFGGCNLKCPYCDTAQSQDMESGQEMSVDQILKELFSKGIKNVVLTGGEPLLQNHTDLIYLTQTLHLHHFNISIETNGTLDIPEFLTFCCGIVMDYKPEYQKKMDSKRFLSLNRKDFIKFPIADAGRLQEAIIIQKHLQNAGCKAKFAYSPIFDRSLGGKDIGFNHRACSTACGYIIDSLIYHKVEAVLNLQIHKIIDVA